MINVNKITSTLAKLPDQQLQQYAEMHKNDPYIMALAMSESNRRKEMRAAGQGAQGMQEQPKVVDQMVAEMAPQQLPEDQGIAQLSAGDMNFAGGGIVAFADGGDVERYQVGGAIKATPEFLRFLRSVGGDYVEFSNMDPAGKAALIERFEQSKAAPSAAPTSATALQAAQGPSKAFAAGQAARPYMDKAGKLIKSGAVPVIGGGLSAAQGLSEVDAAQAFYDDPNVPVFEKGKQFARTAANVALPYAGGVIGSGVTPFLGTAVGAGLGAGAAAYIDDEGEALKQYRAKNEPSKAPSGATIRSQLNRADAATYAQPGVDNAPAAGATAAASPSAAPSSVLSPSTLARTGDGRGGPATGATTPSGLRDEKGIASLFSELLKTQKYEDPAKGEVDKLAQEQLAAATKRKEEYDAFVAKQGDVYKDRSDRLAEREKGIGKQVDQNLGLALLNAGLAIMSTPGGLATAIGKGAQVGTAQYAAGLDRINAARDRLNDAKDKMEELRMNRDELTFKQRSALEADIDKAKTDARKMSIDGIRTAAGITEQRAGKILDKTLDVEKTRFEQGEMTKRTLATIKASGDNRKEQLWKGLMQKHNNDPVAAAKEYNAIEAGDKPTQVAEKMVQDRVADYEKANKTTLALMAPQERDAAIRKATEQYRKDIYTQLKLSPTIGAGASSNSGFKFRGVEPAP